MYLQKSMNLLSTVVPLPKLIPCTKAEIELLESQLQINLPGAYKQFLAWVGKGTGSFLVGSNCFYEHLPSLKRDAEELLEENDFATALPDDAFVFFMHQGYQFAFMRLSEGENPAIYYYHEAHNSTGFTKTDKSLDEFLVAEIRGHISVSNMLEKAEQPTKQEIEQQN